MKQIKSKLNSTVTSMYNLKITNLLFKLLLFSNVWTNYYCMQYIVFLSSVLPSPVTFHSTCVQNKLQLAIKPQAKKHNSSPAINILNFPFSAYRAFHAYTGGNEDELTFKENETILVLQETKTGWWRGSTYLGEGWFPATFVEVSNRIFFFFMQCTYRLRNSRKTNPILHDYNNSSYKTTGRKEFYKIYISCLV